MTLTADEIIEHLLSAKSNFDNKAQIAKLIGNDEEEMRNLIGSKIYATVYSSIMVAEYHKSVESQKNEA